MNNMVICGLGNLDFRVMFDYMKCRSCQRFPSPFYRFICEDSHLLCAYCVNMQFETNGDICSLNLEDPWKIAGGSKKGAEAKPVATCQKTVTRCPADPVYTAFFNRTMWKCPGTIDPEKDDDPNAGGCLEIVRGDDLFVHLQDVHERSNQRNTKRKVVDEWDYTPSVTVSFEMYRENKPRAGPSCPPGKK